MRGTGNTTKVIYQALMSDRLHVFIFAPTERIKRHMKKLLLKHGGKPDSVHKTVVVIAGRTYYFYSVVPGINRELFHNDDYDVFFDHTLLDWSVSDETRREMELMKEITLRKRAQTNGKV